MYVDKRIRPKGFMAVRPNFSVEPDMQGDFRDLDFPDASFSLVVFDPPHTIRNKEEGGGDCGTLRPVAAFDVADRYRSRLFRVLARAETEWHPDFQMGRKR